MRFVLKRGTTTQQFEEEGKGGIRPRVHHAHANLNPIGRKSGQHRFSSQQYQYITNRKGHENRPCSRYPPSFAQASLDGIKAMPRRGISVGKQVIKFATTSNRGRVCLSFQNDKAILNLQNVQFKFRQVPRHNCSLLGHLRSVLQSKNNNNHFHA